VRSGAIALALFASGVLHSAEAPTSIESFCDNDTVGDPSLSPDGTKLAYLTSTGRDLAIAVFHLDTGRGEVLCRVDSRTDAFCWKDDSRILFVEDLGSERLLKSVTVGKNSLNSFPGYGDRRKIASVFDWLPGDPKHILVRTRRIGIMDVDTGEVVDTQPSDRLQFVGPYIADATGALRLRCIQWASGIELQHRRTDHDEFVTAYKWTWTEPFVHIQGFAGDANTAYFLTHDDGDWCVLRGFDTTTFKLSSPLVTFKGAEIRSALFSRDRGKIVGLSVDGGNDVFEYWLDETMRRNQAVVDASLPGHKNRITSWSRDMSVLIVHSMKGSEPGTYYSLDMKNKALVRLGGRHPQVDSAKLGKVTRADIVARDGFTIHAVVTVPSGGAKGPYPLVLFPQSEIFKTRWSVEYNVLTQFLASRGYASLCVDYRGSSGYGQSYEDAGRHEIAGKIPDDIEDAALWSIKSGYATKGRICIDGYGFGGTLALIAATSSPELYCCVINQGGEADLERLGRGYRDGSDWLTLKKMDIYLGDDTKALSRRSPLSAMDLLRVPILNVYDDPDHDESWNRLESALRHSKKPYVLFKNLIPSNDVWPFDYRTNYLQQIEGFLEKNLLNAPSS